MWGELEQIYAESLWEARIEIQAQTPEEAIKALEEDLLKKEMFFTQRLTNMHQAQPSVFCTYPVVNSRPESLGPIIPINHYRGMKRVAADRDERNKMARYVFQIDQMKYRLKETALTAMMEREEHLYDCERRNDALGDVDDYYGY